LTEKGRDLLPLLLDMVLWGATHDPKMAVPEEFVRRLKRDRAGVIREFRSRLRES
jgi:DNA-binding HxlR family transcriptional regulator